MLLGRESFGKRIQHKRVLKTHHLSTVRFHSPLSPSLHTKTHIKYQKSLKCTHTYTLKMTRQSAFFHFARVYTLGEPEQAPG